MRKKFFLVFAAAFVLPYILGQSPRRIRPPVRRPAIVTTTFTGLKVGIDTDGSAWTTTLWFLDGDLASERSPSAAVTTTDTKGGVIFLAAQRFGSVSTPVPTDQMELSLPAWNGLSGIVLAAPNTAFPAQSVNAEVKMPTGYLCFALIRRVSGTDILSSTIITNPPLMAPPPVTEFVMGVPVLGHSVDLGLTFNNPNSFDVTVTFMAYDDGVSDPFASANVVLPAKRITASLLISQIFAASGDFNRHLAGSSAPAPLAFRAVSEDLFAMSANRVDFANDGSLVLTQGSQVFPLLLRNDR